MTRGSLIRVALVVAVMTAGLMLAVPAAQAATTVLTLTSDHCTDGCGPQNGGFGTVTLTDVAGGVQITVHLINGNKFVLTGNTTDIVDFNSTTFPPTVPGFSVQSNPFGAANPLTLVTNNQADGFGTFDFAVVCLTCGKGGANAVSGDLVFTLTGVTIANLTSEPLVEGALFVVDILSGTTGKTGYVDAGGGTPPVPEPGTMLLLGVGLVAVSVAARRRWTAGR